jgi:hypothetical protein
MGGEFHTAKEVLCIQTLYNFLSLKKLPESGPTLCIFTRMNYKRTRVRERRVVVWGRKRVILTTDLRLAWWWEVQKSACSHRSTVDKLHSNPQELLPLPQNASKEKDPNCRLKSPMPVPALRPWSKTYYTIPSLSAVPLLKRKKIKAKKIKKLKKNYLIPKISMELPIGTIETLVNCNSQRKKTGSLKRFQLPRNTSPKRKSAKNITTDLCSLACLLALVTLPSSLSRISWRKLPIKKLLMRVCTYTVANPDGISVVRKVLLLFYFF